jgi:membrane-anchored protein YejM (alkaline phosphatase superfamily)
MLCHVTVYCTISKFLGKRYLIFMYIGASLSRYGSKYFAKQILGYMSNTKFHRNLQSNFENETLKQT